MSGVPIAAAGQKPVIVVKSCDNYGRPESFDRLSVGFCLAVLMLLMMLGWEWSPYPEIEVPAPPTPKLNKVAPMIRSNPNELALEIMDRPLFLHSRRWPAKATAVVELAAPLPRLSATIISLTLREAIFIADDGKVSTLHIGSTVGEWHIINICPGLVTLGQPNGEMQLKPTFQPATPDRGIANQVTRFPEPLVAPMATPPHEPAILRSNIRLPYPP